MKYVYIFKNKDFFPFFFFPFLRPNVGDTRHINIEMTSDPVGFQIDSTMSGGIFVSSVSENSLATEHGLFVGDQLLEVRLLHFVFFHAF